MHAAMKMMMKIMLFVVIPFLFFNETNVKDKLKENQLRHKGLPPTGTENVHFHEVLRDASQPR